MKCPHCADSTLTDHETFAPKSGGAFHCFECGCCFLPDGKTPRPGVPVCVSEKEAVFESEEKPISRMNRTELVAMATDLGIAFTDETTVAQLRELIKAPEGE